MIYCTKSLKITKQVNRNRTSKDKQYNDKRKQKKGQNTAEKIED